MAQLSDDCFAHDQRLMPLDEALALLAERVVPVTGREMVPLGDGVDRILAENLVTAIDVPGHDNSAVDGYAVYFDDLEPEAETRLIVAGRIAAGHPLRRAARRGEALRVFTGAAMPAGHDDSGPDTVFMQEDCRLDGDSVVVPPGIARGANRRGAGEDVAAGATVLEAGRRLRPEDLGLAAAIGRSRLPVRRPLRVALFSTGDEVRDPGAALAEGAIYDANRYAIGALLRRLGCAVTDLGILTDDAAVVRDAIAAAARDHDLLLTSGGVSVGDEDHVKAAVEASGTLTFWRLAIKPGRPLALGQVDDGDRKVPFVGLPGNPAAVMVTFVRLARPLILRLSGASQVAPSLYPVRAGFSHDKKPDRREFLRCRVSRAEDGIPVATKAGRQGAGILSAVSAADGLVELPEEMTYLEAGTLVDFLPFSEVS
ncbi:MAG: molybdopterin molybdotransferase MoeA [Alphaproteobacteria bacterium]|nr:molybdopterin molybdotransferase MoeA [Alphaproteobacteria bacterium]MDP6515590.1 molybdopterin molybdotransferase MoeA [Alphaproteobacteria bacterium]